MWYGGTWCRDQGVVSSCGRVELYSSTRWGCSAGRRGCAGSWPGVRAAWSWKAPTAGSEGRWAARPAATSSKPDRWVSPKREEERKGKKKKITDQKHDITHPKQWTDNGLLAIFYFFPLGHQRNQKALRGHSTNKCDWIGLNTIVMTLPSERLGGIIGILATPIQSFQI